MTDFLAEVRRLDEQGTPEEILAFADEHLPHVEDQLTNEQLDAVCAGVLEGAAMTLAIRKWVAGNIRRTPTDPEPQPV